MSFLFKIQLNDISDPPVWRKVLVPETFTFERFHYVIQAAFGWEYSHLYEFSPGGYGTFPTFGLTDGHGFSSEANADYDAAKVKLSKVFTKANQYFIYIYDFGDSWEHEIFLETITKESPKKATLIAGEGACPPEDCGGPWGYEALKAVLADPKHPEHAGMKEWLGLQKNQKWDADRFDLLKTVVLVQKV